MPGSSVLLRVGDGLGGCPPGFDSVLDLFDPMHNLLAESNDDGAPPCSMLAAQKYPAVSNLPVGTYVARVAATAL